MINFIKEHKLYFSLGIGVLIIVIYFVYQPFEDQGIPFEEQEDFLKNEEANVVETAEVEIRDETVIVDVKGAVMKPGVYEAEQNDRVIDLINMAGGLNETADEAKINFAMRVEDEMVIYVPKVGEEVEESGTDLLLGAPAASGQAKNDGKVNLNTANETELQTLPGIGPAKASAIIEFRETNGPFKVIEDLKSISGIGDKTFEKLKDSIKVK
ncbi:helix-hairpin-helix domain-containing protein [Bacillus sp. FJAT-49705]|uniref:Helix-hairpin-helix domain-containing protein n=1 Tax=Cytobacillus citreus TaxID=2833586 RepID=A0ABS5NU79_9BACI|nr:helix-hairpin-helix domain-containing protein [Cytobacillus citreus]MBS4191368.1 helix-hairpin-helix domain-containing protein [Cytobacillus citreus]